MDEEPNPNDALPAVPAAEKSQVVTKLMKWAKVIGLVAGILGALSTGWKMFDAINDLHDTILSNKKSVAEMKAANEEEHRQARVRLGEVAVAIRTTRERDQEVVTQLRIAVAAIQASTAAREGRVAYTGIDSLPGMGGRPPLALAREVRPPPRTTTARIAQSQHAEEDAQEALRRAFTAQRQADQEDPLARLGGF